MYSPHSSVKKNIQFGLLEYTVLAALDVDTNVMVC